MDERELVRHIIRGDKEVFREVVEKHQRLVMHIVFRLIPAKDDREDICQEVFVKVYRNLASFKFNSKLSTWIARIAKNTCLNHLEKKRLPAFDDIPNQNLTIDDIPGDYDTPYDFSEKSDTKDILAGELEKLPLKYKLVLTLFHLENMNYSEIAQITDLPEGTIKSHLFRGRKHLKDRLTANYSQEELA